MRVKIYKGNNSLFILALIFAFPFYSFSQNTSNHGNKFEQLGSILPTGNEYRGMDGAPGPDYWQQRCNYDIECTLDTDNQRLDGEELITYFNQSPSTLTYLWLQLDENQHDPNADNLVFDPSSINPVMNENALRNLEPWQEMDQFGCKIEAVTNENGTPLNYFINKTMMRIDLPQPLKYGE